MNYLIPSVVGVFIALFVIEFAFRYAIKLYYRNKPTLFIRRELMAIQDNLNAFAARVAAVTTAIEALPAPVAQTVDETVLNNAITALEAASAAATAKFTPPA